MISKSRPAHHLSSASPLQTHYQLISFAYTQALRYNSGRDLLLPLAIVLQRTPNVRANDGPIFQRFPLNLALSPDVEKRGKLDRLCPENIV